MLTDGACSNAKGGDKPYKVTDDGGLFLYFVPGGSKLWRMRAKRGGNEMLLSFGPYPEVSLAAAREKRDAARAALREGRDPREAKRLRIAAANGGATSFEAVARAWHARNVSTWTKQRAADVLGSLEADVFPKIGTRHIPDITAPEVLAVLRPIEARPAKETARRVRQRMSAVFQFAIAGGTGQNDPAAVVKGQMAPLVKGR